MKKILLSALFYGFVLNNGYCFDEEHKITNEFLDRAFYQLVEIWKKVSDLRDTLNVSAAALIDEDYRFLHPLIGMLDNVRYKIHHNLETFGTEFLNTQIPYGNYQGKIVEELLREHKLNNGHVKTICDDSVGFFMINNDDDNIIFFKICGGAMVKVNLYSYREKEKFTALLMLCVDKRYEVEFDIKSLLTSF